MFVCEQANSQYASTSEVLQPNTTTLATMATHNLSGSSMAQQHSLQNHHHHQQQQQQSPSHTVHISSNPDESLKELFTRSLSNSVQMHNNSNNHHLNNRMNNHPGNNQQNGPQNSQLQQHSPTSASGGSLPPRLCQRNFPASFFTPPSQCSSATHSRESSLDAGTLQQHQQQQPPFNSPSRVNSKPPTPISAAALHGSPSPLSSSPASPPTIMSPAAQVNFQQQGTAILLVNSSGQAVGGPLPSPGTGSVAGKRLTIMHSRARSLPVTLKNGQQQVFSLPPVHSVPQNVQASRQVQTNSNSTKGTGGIQATSPQLKSVASQHYRQHSYDINKLQLPEGWSMSFTPTGERYFLNHKDKSTTWEDPRKELLRRELAAAAANSNNTNNSNSHGSMLGRQALPNYSNTSASSQQQNMLAQQQQLAATVSTPTVSASASPSSAYPLEFTADLPLPEGWVQARTVTTGPSGASTGEVVLVYYVNMNEQTTSWYHPSVQRQLQLKTVTLKQQSSGSIDPPSFLATIQQIQLQQQQQQQQQQVQQQQANISNNNNNNNIPSDLLSALENMTTDSSNCSPSDQQQQQQQLFKQLQQPNMGSSGDQSILRDLQLERERMRQRQGEILQSPQLMKSGGGNAINNLHNVNNNQNNFLSNSSPSSAFTHPNSDPFLSSAALGISQNHNTSNANSNSMFSSAVSNHNRQASLDSGLGGSGGSVVMMGGGGQLGTHQGQPNLFGSEQNLLLNGHHHPQQQQQQQHQQLQLQQNQHLFSHHSQQHSSPAAMTAPAGIVPLDEQMMMMTEQQQQCTPQFSTTQNSNNNGSCNQQQQQEHIDDLSFIDSIDLMPSLDMDILSDMEELLSTPNRDNIMTWL